MNRRHFLSLAAAPLLAQDRRATTPPARPNLAILSIDGVGAWMPGCYGNKAFRTPGIDELARAGLRFLYAFAASPAVPAGYSSLLSGLSPAQLAAKPETPSIAASLAQKGYQVENCATGSPQAITGQAIEFLSRQQAGKPFALLVRYPGPADPPANLPPEHLTLFEQETFDSVNWERPAPSLTRAERPRFDRIADHLRAAAAALSWADAGIAAITRQLRASGLALETMIAFTSAAGSFLGRRGLWSDANTADPPSFLDPVVHVPLIVSWPGRVPVQATTPELASAYDLAPTLAEVAGFDKPAGASGLSLSPLLSGRPLPVTVKERKKRGVSWRSTVFAELGDHAMARDARFKLVLRPAGDGELYDLRADAAERNNRFDDPGYLNVRERLSGECADWRRGRG